MNSDQFGKNIAPFNYDLFFERIRYCELNKLETYRIVEHITDNFEVDKLELLYQDFESYVIAQKGERLAEFDDDDHRKAIAEFKSRGLEIPYTDLDETTRAIIKKHKIVWSSNTMIDTEKLLFPDEFKCCYQFLTSLKQLTRKHENRRRSVSDANNSSSIFPHTNIDPFRFLKLKRSEFLSNLTKQNNIPSQRAVELYNELLVLLESINQNRADEIFTKELVKDKSKNLTRIESDLVENWLLKAVSLNDSFVYAYNYLAQKINRRAKWAKHALREISEAELFILLTGNETTVSVQQKPPASVIDVNKNESPAGRRKKPVKSFAEFFDTNNQLAFAETLKKKFAKDNPTTLTVLVHTLRHEFEKPLLIINSGEFSMFHKAMQEYFGGIDIGKRQLYNRDKSVFSLQYKDVARNCKSRILSILKSIDN